MKALPGGSAVAAAPTCEAVEVLDTLETIGKTPIPVMNIRLGFLL